VTEAAGAPSGELQVLLELFERAERECEQVSMRELRRLARNSRLPTGRLSVVLRQAVEDAVVLWDDRQRMVRGGRLVPWRLYRLNRRHPAATAMAGVRLDQELAGGRG
jgi:hypothetical protein